MAADGSGNETAASPVVEVAAAPWVHVDAVIKGNTLTASVGAATASPTTLSFTFPDALSRGDVALRAYPGVTLEVSGWRLAGATGGKKR